jgi:hypothetical protein
METLYIVLTVLTLGVEVAILVRVTELIEIMRKK